MTSDELFELYIKKNRKTSGASTAPLKKGYEIKEGSLEASVGIIWLVKASLVGK